MNELQPSTNDWKNLYDAAAEFKKISCWNWMLDSDLFGVQNPENDEIGYCCITGQLGEHFALVVYLGTEGLEAYLKMQSGDVDPVNFDLFAIQKCLMASFEDRDYLLPDDRKIIKELGLKFRGSKEWPLFRTYLPTYAPWYLTQDEAIYLTLAIQQAIEVSLRFKEKPDMLIPPGKDQYLVRVPEKTNGVLNWTDKWLKRSPSRKSDMVAPPLNDILLQKLKKTIKRTSGAWETDFFFGPASVKEGDERPYYPYTILCVDKYSGSILNVEVIKPAEYMREFPNSIMNVIGGAEIKPSKILVRKKEAFDLLKPVAAKLSIELELQDRLEILEFVQIALFQYLK